MEWNSTTTNKSRKRRWNPKMLERRGTMTAALFVFLIFPILSQQQQQQQQQQPIRTESWVFEQQQQDEQHRHIQQTNIFDTSSSSTTTSSSNYNNDRLDCTSDKIPFNPRVHKPNYRIGVYSMEHTYEDFTTTFTDYLSATAGRRFDPPITFTMMVLPTVSTVYEKIANDDIDFLFANPGIYSCASVEYSVQSLVTIISRYPSGIRTAGGEATTSTQQQQYELDVGAGVILTRANHTEIHTIQDLKGKIIAAGGYANSMIFAGQVQFHEMMKYDPSVSYVMDAKQMIFTNGDQQDIVRGVYHGTYDVGLVQTGMLERTTLSSTSSENDNDNDIFVDPYAFKVIQPQIHVLENGDLFPFLHSTNIYPEWPVSVLDHISNDVSKEVSDALLALSAHAAVGEQLLTNCTSTTSNNNAPCQNEDATTILSQWKTRCDTTPYLAMLAFQATQKGNFAGFRVSKSYADVRTMQQEGGFLQTSHTYTTSDATTNAIQQPQRYCTRAVTLYDSIDCPKGHYKVTETQFKNSCSFSLGLRCPHPEKGYECFCEPCIAAFEVDVFPVKDEDKDAATAFLGLSNLRNHKGCEKMSLCGSIEQTKTITLRAIDNNQRDNAIVTAWMYLGTTTKPIPVTELESTPYVYELQFSHDQLGVAIIEIYINGEQIPESPIRVQIIERNCNTIDGTITNKIANENGACICKRGTFDITGRNHDGVGKCISTAVIGIVVSITIILILAEGYRTYRNMKNKKNDQLWHIGVDELNFDDPVHVIGQGSFGVVLLAECRGSKVAIKRAIKQPKASSATSSRTPTRSRNGLSGGSSHGGGGSVASTVNSSSKSRPQPSSSSASTAAGPTTTTTTINTTINKSIPEEDAVNFQESIDVETPPSSTGEDAAAAGNVAALMAAGDDNNMDVGKSAGNDSIGFLATDFGNTAKWNKWFCPWKTTNEYHARFKESILVDSANVAKPTLLGKLFPCCDELRRQREEFIAEMRLLSRLRHPCITTVLGAVMTRDNDAMLVTEYMEYGSLHGLLRNETVMLSGDIILQILRDIGQGLRFLHSSKPIILHGDLKARNILIDSRFRAKLCDFGLSTNSKNTTTGTPYWLAPEYLRGEIGYTAECDIYSLGMLLYEIYARKNPYEGEIFREVLRNVCDRRVNKRPIIPKSCPHKIVDLMKKCWGPDPYYRPHAKDFDMIVMEMSPQDTEPILAPKFVDVDRQKKSPYELFPKYIANALKAGQKVDSESHDLVTVVFVDIVRFIDIAREISPMKVSNLLHRLYLCFDKNARRHDVFKVETIGNAYMGVTNLEANQNDTHVKHIAEFAISMIREASKILIDEEDPSKGYISIRIGFNSGPVITDVLGALNPRYSLFGDTVNTASRMESNSTANRILCSERSYKILKEQAPQIPTKKRGKIFIKGKGDMDVYWVGVGASKVEHREGRHVGFQIEESSHNSLE